jgi:hypothetical protein
MLLPPFVFVLNGEDWAETQTKKKNWGNWTEKEKKKTGAEPRREIRNRRKEQRRKNREPARKNPKQRKNKRITQEHTMEPKQSFGRSSITPPSPESDSKPGEQKRRRAREQESFAFSRPGKFFLFHAFHFNSPATVHFEFLIHTF